MKFTPPLAIAAISALAAASSQAAVIARQDFETSPASPVLAYTTTQGTTEINTGAVAGAGVRPVGSTWGVDSGTGISFTSNSGEITFAPINTVGLTDIGVSLRLAALSLTSGNGLDAGDTFTVSVSADNGVTFSDQIRVTGLANATWSFSGASGDAGRVYSTSAVSSFSPEAGGARTTDGYTNLSITGLPAVANLVIRLTATADANEKWLVDNVVVQAVPEPAAAALGVLGSLLLLRRRR